MIIFLCDAIPGDRFLAPSGVGWVVLWNHGGYLKMISDNKQQHQGIPPAGMTVQLTNRDDSLTDGQAISNMIDAGLTGKVVNVE